MPHARTRRHSRAEKKIPLPALQDPFEQEDALDEVDDESVIAKLPVLLRDMDLDDDDDYYDARMTGLGECIDNHLRDYQS